MPPLVVLGLAAAGLLSPFWLVGALAWLSHIVADLAFGHGLRTPDGWRRPWWALDDATPTTWWWWAAARPA